MKTQLFFVLALKSHLVVSKSFPSTFSFLSRPPLLCQQDHLNTIITTSLLDGQLSIFQKPTAISINLDLFPNSLLHLKAFLFAHHVILCSEKVSEDFK